ncbi:MAG: DUF4184 family protein [Armatimonadota bacterium]|nr:DUF4184 family protein [Armatimonadota bacterium]
MPLTPFHLGPAIALKVSARRHFSLRIFTLTQIVIDLESARGVLVSASPLHGPLHSLAGATLAGLLAAVLGRHIFNALNPLFRSLLRQVEGMPAWLVGEVVPITWAAALIGGTVGGISHVLLDAVIHPDVSPFWPFSSSNPFLRDGSFYLMHYACTLVGLIGALAWLALAKHNTRGGSRSP